MSREERRERILAAAARVFAASGYDAAGMREVATAAGISTPVLYDHFPSKARLYAGLLESEVDSLLAGWAELPPSETAEELLRGRVAAIFAWMETNERGWRMIFAETPSDPGVAEVHRRGQARATGQLTEVFAQVPHLALTADLPRDRANEALAEAAKSALNAIATWWWSNRDIPREQVVALTTDLLWRGLGALIQEDT
ncbi:TetR/AcrR family transcriptional regulator [Amycolatopsis umgeniensis]|uniref:AcrR family transcriptional regulator n=1 Tax=Amycolatopsis umgeniensis TaxID=336628 RepID=A0A841B5U0_9PSEU|nr:TetR/AcrR family transcriptional regulator [Amycolatopsis umgeniensis]MBB5854313.1 AcrR family transcriptional regulator [Amycolatopsis umgeniensis]